MTDKSAWAKFLAALWVLAGTIKARKIRCTIVGVESSKANPSCP